MDLKYRIMKFLGHKTEDELEEAHELESFKGEPFPVSSKEIVEKFMKRLYGPFFDNDGDVHLYDSILETLQPGEYNELSNELKFDIIAYVFSETSKWQKMATQNIVIGFVIGVVITYLLMRGV